MNLLKNIFFLFLNFFSKIFFKINFYLNSIIFIKKAFLCIFNFFLNNWDLNNILKNIFFIFFLSKYLGLKRVFKNILLEIFLNKLIKNDLFILQKIFFSFCLNT
jgi:hypothetical protein